MAPEQARSRAEEDFLTHIGAQPTSSDAVDTAAPIAVKRMLAYPVLDRGVNAGPAGAPPPRADAEHRSVIFPFGAAGAVGTAALGAALFSPAAGLALASVAVFMALHGSLELGLFFWMALHGSPVSDQELLRAVKQDLLEWKAHSSLISVLTGEATGRPLIKAYRADRRLSGWSFGFTLPNAIYLRPELARMPRLRRWILKHEIYHFQARRARGPPRFEPRSRRLLDSFLSELRARLADFFPASSLRALRTPIPALERLLHEAQLSLRFLAPYDLLILNNKEKRVRSRADAHSADVSEELSDPSIYAVPSAGQARVVSQDAADFSAVSAYLDQKGNRGRFRFIVYPKAYEALPKDPKDGRRLDLALERINKIYRLAQRLQVLGTERWHENRPEIREIERLSVSLGVRKRGKLTPDKLAALIADLYFRMARTQLKGIPLVNVLEGAYRGMHTKGVLLLPFAAADPGLDTVERLLRYWRAPDTGRFLVERVDLPEGGHVIVARKEEPRVNLWLRPVEGKLLERSETNISSGPDYVRDEERVLREAGFGARETLRFHKAGMQVRHVFGADVGENRIFVSVHKSHAKALRRYADEEGIKMEASRGDYRLHLLQSVPLQKVDKAWRLRVTGKDGRIFDIDTGLDVAHPDFINRLMECLDLTGEGAEDWEGHGSHKAGIEYADGPLYKGTAPEALGRMAKVFSRDGAGASDGNIMAAAVEAMKWPADVLSLSLGSPGTVDERLAVFLSKLAEEKGIIVTASAGNSGPFNETMSQPSTGRNVISVAAANKDLAVSFFSSVGFAVDKTYYRERFALKPEITGVGGDVGTPPGEKDAYRKGVESVKSKDMSSSASDAEDGLHTRMSGTSMSNPMVAGVALLVKQAALKAAAANPDPRAKEFLEKNLPFAVKMILMQSAGDMHVPAVFEGAGFMDAEAAVRLAAESFGAPGGLKQRLLGFMGYPTASSRPAGPTPWDWIRRAREALELEEHVFSEAQAARDKELEKEGTQQQVGDAAARAFEARFDEARAEALPRLFSALKDDAWTVRMYAAFALLNLEAPEALPALAEAATRDQDARARQMALLAMARTPGSSADEQLGRLSQGADLETALYAAWALARHGDPSRLGRLVEGAHDASDKMRFTAAWLLGKMGSFASEQASDALSGRVKDDQERGEIRHLSAASLSEIAAAAPSAINNEAILSLLAAVTWNDPQHSPNFALIRTIYKFFSVAKGSKALRERMRAEPLRDPIVEFVHTFKSSVNKPGALGQLVALLADIVGVPLDLPTPVPDPTGAGVPGVDPGLGPVDLIVELPHRSALNVDKFRDFRAEPLRQSLEAVSSYGLSPQVLERHDARLQVAMPRSQALWISLPDAKVRAFKAELEARGYRVHRALPKYLLIHETGPLSGMPQIRQTAGLDGSGVTVAVLDEGGDTRHPAIEPDRILHKRNFTPEGGVEEVESEGIGHGTHVMGIIGARSVEGSPYVGMAPGVNFVLAKVLGAEGGSEAQVMAGMEWAASLFPDPLKTPLIFNMSIGGPGPSQSPLGRLINAFAFKNIGSVVAVNNDGPLPGTLGSPANAALAFTVAALNKAGKLESYSSRSTPERKEISVADYGGAVRMILPNPFEIVSTLSTGLAESRAKAPTTVSWQGRALYQALSGGSMAAPHSTAKLAVLVQRMLAGFNGRLPHGYMFWLENLVKAHARKVEGRAEFEVGAGQYDEPAALAALEEALKNPQKIAEESAALARQEEQKYGAPPTGPPSRKPGRFRPLRSLWYFMSRWFK